MHERAYAGIGVTLNNITVTHWRPGPAAA